MVPAPQTEVRDRVTVAHLIQVQAVHIAPLPEVHLQEAEAVIAVDHPPAAVAVVPAVDHLQVEVQVAVVDPVPEDNTRETGHANKLTSGVQSILVMARFI